MFGDKGPRIDFILLFRLLPNDKGSWKIKFQYLSRETANSDLSSVERHFKILHEHYKFIFKLFLQMFRKNLLELRAGDGAKL